MKNKQRPVFIVFVAVTALISRMGCAGNEDLGSAGWKAAYPGLILMDGHTNDLVPIEGIAPRQIVASGPYLGQKLPGVTPEIFAPGIVSVAGRQEYGCSLSPDGKDFFFTRGGTIMHCRDDGSGWTRPERAWFDSDDLDHEPHVAAGGTRLFWGSQRPQPGNPDPKPYGIWMIEKRQGGWSDPRYVGSGTQVCSTAEGTLYVTDNAESGTGYLARVTMEEGKFVKYDRLMDGIETLRPRYERIAHPCIAPDGSYIVFDVEGGSHLFVSFMEADGHWGIPVDLTDHGFLKEDGIASVSPDGRFLFFGRGSGNERDIYWVSTKILEALRPIKKDPE